jgi:hypothetical protein
VKSPFSTCNMCFLHGSHLWTPRQGQMQLATNGGTPAVERCVGPRQRPRARIEIPWFAGVRRRLRHLYMPRGVIAQMTPPHRLRLWLADCSGRCRPEVSSYLNPLMSKPSRLCRPRWADSCPLPDRRYCRCQFLHLHRRPPRRSPVRT